MTEAGKPFGNRFTVVCITEDTSTIPQLANFRHKAEYQAAAHRGPSAVVYKVWYGSLGEQSETFDEGTFNRYFEWLPVVHIDPGTTTDIRDDLSVQLLLYYPRDLARGDRLEQLHAPIELAIQSCGQEIERARATVDEFERLWVDEIVDRECDQTEEYLGIAFAATQVVLTAFRTRFVRLLEFCQNDLGINFELDGGKGGGHGLFKHAPELRGCAFTEIQAINAVANYWKHKDEWTVNHEQRAGSTVPVWLPKTWTVDTIMSLGMQPFATGNLRTAAKALGVKRYEDLRPIRSKVDGWMQELLSKAEQKLGVRS